MPVEVTPVKKRPSKRASGLQRQAIFKAYDIRGIVPSTLNEEVALRPGPGLWHRPAPKARPRWPWGAMAG
jgi:phosphomannomutase